MGGWFIILLLVGFGTMLMMAEFVSQLEDPLLTLSRGDILFVLFFFIMAKASSETVENTIRNKTLKHLFTSPIKTRDIQLSRMMRVFWYNMLLVAISMSVVAFLIPVMNIDIPIDRYFFPHLYLLLIAAPMVGFNLGVFTYIPQNKWRIPALFLYGQNITFVWFVTHANLDYIMFSYAVLIQISVSIIILLTSSKVFSEAWKYGITTKTYKSFRFHDAGDFFPKYIRRSIRRMGEKEMLIRWRRRESPATIGVSAVLGIGLLVMYHQLGPNPDLGLGLEKLFYPVLIGMTIYVGVILQVVLPSLTLFSRDGKKMWTFMTLPISKRDVVWGKTLSILIYSPFVPLFIAVPLPLILGYPIHFMLFAVAASFAMIFAFMGIGIWAAAKFPNYDESVNGAPDIITMYTILIACLITGAFLIIYPFNIIQYDYFLGVLAMIFMADISFVALYILINRTSHIVARMELDM